MSNDKLSKEGSTKKREKDERGRREGREKAWLLKCFIFMTEVARGGVLLC
jgi:hypothetical protein